MHDDLNIIRKYYGEKMMHLCRSIFPTLLEVPGLLSNLLLKHFNSNKFLVDDIIKNNYIENFKNYIYSLINVENKQEIRVDANPKELLEQIGYDLYECKNENDIQSFKKYYAKGEELCTFNGGRLNSCHVFFAVKKNVNDIQRKNFERPRREDDYGVSVISIQFSRGKVNTLSIKNRYNHTVNNPDATFSNNLENIVPGLTKSFEENYNLSINQNRNNMFDLNGYVKANDGKYYKYNYEINNIYYCPDNIIIDNFEVKPFPKERFIILDYFIIDLKEKTLKRYDNSLNDSFTQGIENIKYININKIKDTKNKQIEIITNDENKIIIILDNENRIIGYINNNLEKIGDFFLYHNKVLKDLELSNLSSIGNGVLYNNIALENLKLPKTINIGYKFLYKNNSLTNFEAPLVMKIGDYFLYENEILKQLEFKNLIEVGNSFCENNKLMERFIAPELLQIKNKFLCANKNLFEIYIPKVKRIGHNFLEHNEKLLGLDLQHLLELGNDCLTYNQILEKLNLPEIVEIGDEFLSRNNRLIKINFPKLMKVGSFFLNFNNSLIELETPSLILVGSLFLSLNKKLKKFNAPKLRKVDSFFLESNEIKTQIVNKNMLLESFDNLYYKSIVSVKLANSFIEKEIKKLLYSNKMKSMQLDGGYKI